VAGAPVPRSTLGMGHWCAHSRYGCLKITCSKLIATRPSEAASASAGICLGNGADNHDLPLGGHELGRAVQRRKSNPCFCLRSLFGVL
jgi:hypothetical protein